MEAWSIETIKQYLEQHMLEELTLERLAQEFGYTPHHLTRTFKAHTGMSLMRYLRWLRMHAAARELAAGAQVFHTAIRYQYDTHAGFTKAFSEVIGYSPALHIAYQKAKRDRAKGGREMDSEGNIVIRFIDIEDVQDLWENVYCAMTPRQILEDKIRPAMERQKRNEGFELVAEIDGVVRLSLPLTKPAWIPLGFVWDNAYTGQESEAMGLLMRSVIEQARRMGISTLIAPQNAQSASEVAMMGLGFERAYVSGGWSYLMMAI